ncbi:uncharacterized protein ZBAI_03513 [Zygosaccharomyces bailii ISA1307]|nr:uncharacterized protein ZBAI_03513 [Zygosaccharomyces bailii ISA1307]
MLANRLFLLLSALGLKVSQASGETSGCAVSGLTPVCPDLNFNWHEDNTNTMHYTMDLVSVTWISSNLYEITIKVEGAEQIDLKYLWSLKVIGINGPESTHQLYGKNENTYLIDNPTDYTATFQVYGQTVEGDDCKVEMPSFQIQYEYLQGDAAQYSDSWTWGATSFDLMTGCGGDNNGNSNADFPLWYWSSGEAKCGGCGGTSSGTRSSSTTTSKTSYSPSQSTSSSTPWSSSSSSVVPTSSSSSSVAPSSSNPVAPSSSSSSIPYSSTLVPSSSGSTLAPSSSGHSTSSCSKSTSGTITTTSQIPTPSSSGCAVTSLTPVCPDLNFNWHEDNTNTMHYTMDLVSVTWISSNLYEITIKVEGAEQIDLKYLWSLKVIGINGPESTHQLYGKNENTYLIDNPTDYTATFQVYGQAVEGDDCKVEMPSFQIQYEYLQGDAAQYSDSWTWGATSFDLMTGCGGDNNGNSNADFPLWYWSSGEAKCGGCGGTSSGTRSSSTTTSKTSYSPSQSTSSSTPWSSSSSSVVPTSSSSSSVAPSSSNPVAPSSSSSSIPYSSTLVPSSSGSTLAPSSSGHSTSSCSKSTSGTITTTSQIPTPSSSGCAVTSLTPVCPDLNFNWHEDNTNTMHYTMDLVSVTWISSNLYEITIKVEGAEQIDLKYLWSLKVIGINGPESTHQLYGKNENTYLIDNPTDYTATFQVYGQAVEGDDCKVEMPSFQIQYEYLQGDAAQYSDSWTWGATSFDLMTGCGGDKNGNPNAHFPLWYLSSGGAQSGGGGILPNPI